MWERFPLWPSRPIQEGDLPQTGRLEVDALLAKGRSFQKTVLVHSVGAPQDLLLEDKYIAVGRAVFGSSFANRGQSGDPDTIHGTHGHSELISLH